MKKLTHTEGRHYRGSDGKYYYVGDDGVARLTLEEQSKERQRNANAQSGAQSAHRPAQPYEPNAAEKAYSNMEKDVDRAVEVGKLVGIAVLAYVATRYFTDANFRRKYTKVIIAVVLLFFVGIVSLGIYANRDWIAGNIERRANFMVANEGDFSISDMRVVYYDDGIPILFLSAAGTITNNTDRNWEYVVFEFRYTDAYGNEHRASREAVSNRVKEIRVFNIPAGGSAEFVSERLFVSLSRDAIRSTQVEYSNVRYQITDLVITLDRYRFSTGEEIKATIHGIITQQIINGGFIAIYEFGAGNAWRRIEEHRLTDSDGIFIFTAPDAAGVYEMRLYESRRHDARIYRTRFVVEAEPMQD